MSGRAFNSLRGRWFFTLVALVVLFVAGALVSLLVTSGSFSADPLDLRAWLGGRLLFYALVIALWPLLIRCVLDRREIVVSKIPARQPVVALIVFYELLIVQNPLQALLRLWSA